MMGRRRLSVLLANARARAFGAYAFAAVLSLAAAGKLLHLRRMNLRVPLDYGGDTLFFETTLKALLENGWYLTVPRLGAPGVLTMHDFPMADFFHYLVFKGLGLFSHHWALVTNVYFLAGFPLITIAALAVLRYFRVPYAPALAASLLYAFLPTRLLVGEAHIFLDVYYQVPLAILVALWVCEEAPPLWTARPGRRWPALELRRGRSVAAVAIGLLTAATGVYYAFFAIVLIGVAGLWASWDRRTPLNALAGLSLCAVILAGLTAQAVPSLLYHHLEGPNLQVAHRETGESEIFGMKISELLLPAAGHRVTALRELKARYDAGTVPSAVEGSTISLGVVGALGFLSLLGLLLVGPRPGRPRDDLLRSLAVLNLTAVLLGTIGGFGALVALLITPMIRTYSRVNVFVAFLSLFAVTLHLERLCSGRRLRMIGISAAILSLGLLDQVTPSMAPRLAETEVAYKRDAELFARVEAAVQPNAMIFQLPYNWFPEGTAAPGFIGTGYDGARAYLHSRTLRWSFPSMPNRGADAWITRVAALPSARMIQQLSDAGFAGILVDRAGYPDHGKGIDGELGAALGTPIAGGDGQRWLFFDLAPYARRVSAGRSPEERQRLREAVLHAAYVRWGLGFFGPESRATGPFRWCSQECRLEIVNDTPAPRRTALSARIFAAQAPADLIVDGDLASARAVIPPEGLPFARELDVPPGRHFIRLRSNGRRANAPADPRVLVFLVENLRFEDLTSR